MIRHDLALRVLACAAFGSVLLMALPASPQQPRSQEDVEREYRELAWQRGPTEGRIGSTATIKVPDGQAFLDGPNTRRFLELNRNPGRDNHYTLVSERSGWFAVFSFADSGYVKDDEKLDANALLKSLQDSDGPSNEERKRLGLPALHTEGWHVPPHYDAASRRLEWGVRLRGERGSVVNYTIRILGRRGVMNATLVSEPQDLDRDIAVFKTSLGGFDFVSGDRYAEFKAGDRVAEYGLAALVLGGAAVVATKTGFIKAFWKLLVIGVIAFGGAATAFFRRLFRRS
ncbi:MAG: DUF2167 domain-containing protein [Candidatus Rokubacteria bacterium]|nr:DUF2167 domain-containing protein [Candidatus Rokubacteria bacterium]